MSAQSGSSKGIKKVDEAKRIGIGSLSDEVLEHLFKFLPEESLLACNQVSNAWAEIIEKMPLKMSWNPWFDRGLNGEAMVTFRQTYGSRFERPQDIINIREGMADPQLEEQVMNPFNNRTVIVNKNTLEEYRSLHEEMAGFMTQFGHYVHRLMYYIDSDTPQSVKNLNSIFNTMSNLRSLTLYAPNDRMHGAFGILPFPAHPRFFELELLDNIGVDFTYLESLMIAHAPQIQNLTFYSEITEQIARAVQNCLNLKRFKISFLDLEYSDTDWPPYFKELRIESLSIRNLKCSDYACHIDGSVSHIMKALSIFKDTIETLSFFGKPSKKKCKNEGQFLATTCTYLQHLIILFSWTASETFSDLLRRFPNLKKLTLFDKEDVFLANNLEKEKLSKICEPLWAHVPPSVESICIRSRVHSNKFKKYFPTLFTCSRN